MQVYGAAVHDKMRSILEWGMAKKMQVYGAAVHDKMRSILEWGMADGIQCKNKSGRK
jgi:hypothetical protein